MVAVVPPWVSTWIDCSITWVIPVVSTDQFTPRPFVSFLTSSTTSTLRLLITSVAPNSLANSSRESTISIPITLVHPEILPAIMAASPTAPVPKTAIVSPGRGLRVLSTVPEPVTYPQPSGPNLRRSSSSSTLTAFRSRTTVVVVKEL